MKKRILARLRGRSVALATVALLIAATLLTVRANQTVLRIRDWKTGELYVEAEAGPGDQLFFGWIHSLELIPWNEYYYIASDDTLLLDTITFPAFGAGIPEDKGKVCRIVDGLIYMEQIEETFPELVWLNSHTATQEIRLNDRLLTRGSLLPQHVRLRLSIEKRGLA